MLYMFLLWFLDVAFASSCMPDPKGPEHPMLTSTIVVVGTIGEAFFEAGSRRILVPVVVGEVIKGDPTLRELKVVQPGMMFVGQKGATVLLHLAPHWQDPGSYSFAGRSCYEFPAIEKHETGICGAVAYLRAGAVVGTYPADTKELPSMFAIDGELTRVNDRLVQQQPTPDELCGGMLWDELLISVRKAATSSAGGK